MSSLRQQAVIDSPLESTWELVATPNLYPNWWPRVIEVDGREFEQGDEFVQVIRDARGTTSSNFLIERREEFREIRMSCQLSGTFAHWTLTAAQDGTFVDLEMGMEPRKLRYRLVDATIGQRYFRKWSEESLDGLRDAARGRLP
jgi:uncharacterized protein YndB with AHSA1/START domain